MLTITATDVEKTASQALDIDVNIDLGPSPNGGRYYGSLMEELRELGMTDDNLRDALLMGLRVLFLTARRGGIRETILRKLEQRRRELAQEGK